MAVNEVKTYLYLVTNMAFLTSQIKDVTQQQEQVKCLAQAADILMSLTSTSSVPNIEIDSIKNSMNNLYISLKAAQTTPDYYTMFSELVITASLCVAPLNLSNDNAAVYQAMDLITSALHPMENPSSNTKIDPVMQTTDKLTTGLNVIASTMTGDIDPKATVSCTSPSNLGCSRKKTKLKVTDDETTELQNDLVFCAQAYTSGSQVTKVEPPSKGILDAPSQDSLLKCTMASIDSIKANAISANTVFSNNQGKVIQTLCNAAEEVFISTPVGGTPDFFTFSNTMVELALLIIAKAENKGLLQDSSIVREALDAFNYILNDLPNNPTQDQTKAAAFAYQSAILMLLFNMDADPVSAIPSQCTSPNINKN